jgi:ribose-phosphate pyrophosphokinase
MNIIGEVKDKNCILIDDIIDSAGTISGAAKALKEKGAKDIFITATHAIFSGPAIERLKDDSIKEVVVTNTIAIPEDKKFDKLKIISLAKILSDSITKIYEGTPMGVLFDDLYKKIEEKRK